RDRHRCRVSSSLIQYSFLFVPSSRPARPYHVISYPRLQHVCVYIRTYKHVSTSARNVLLETSLETSSKSTTAVLVSGIYVLAVLYRKIRFLEKQKTPTECARHMTYSVGRYVSSRVVLPVTMY
ncbi:unnamed protein product, partial [Pylaiella littoralis]